MLHIPGVALYDFNQMHSGLDFVKEKLHIYQMGQN